jgi:hypothetical protein
MAYYYIDLNTVTPTGSLPGPCYCGGGPVYTFNDYAFGDVLDFGQVQIFAQFGTHNPTSMYGVIGAPSVGYRGEFPRQAFGSTLPALPGSSMTFDLVYSISSDPRFMIGWDSAGYIYTPSPMSAVPELSSWALMLLGFVAIAFRKRLLWRVT